VNLSRKQMFLDTMVGWLRPKFQARPVLRIARHSFTPANSDIECYGKAFKSLKGGGRLQVRSPPAGQIPLD